jgi:hypothetical protein
MKTAVIAEYFGTATNGILDYLRLLGELDHRESYRIKKQ